MYVLLYILILSILGGACRSRVTKKLRHNFINPADAERHFKDLSEQSCTIPSNTAPSVAVALTIDNIHGTGLETCHVSAFERVQNEAATPCYGDSHLTGVRTLLSLHIIYSILYLKDRIGSCGTILEKPWGL